MRVLTSLALAGLGALSLFLAGYYSPYTDDASTVAEPWSVVWLGVACAVIGLSCVGAAWPTKTGSVALGLAALLTAATAVALLIEPPGKTYALAADEDGDFTSESLTVAGEVVPVSSGGVLSVSFKSDGESDVVAWTIGCNSMGAEVEIEDDTLLTGGFDQTLVGCRKRVAAQERLLGRFFQSDPKWELHGETLYLSDKADLSIALDN